ncbi:Arylsulfatase [Pedobacter sp. Bi27]|uniref:arylsulfatase n=1 Tax=unclassified Pedobacter TaxID=2628915 RepID=UPI001D9D67E7|nr:MULTISPECIES: arylsulfatase [unclassified Pedobacter]CAH0123641.1 Arylsulfatase [Pedobacter sp. Bi36]CAH0175375.1 Arylsulfatase [Pedobacter sp. Bi126]CAH0285411.1 Arylsulfatase [Pedobacter sp. Bi27]
MNKVILTCVGALFAFQGFAQNARPAKPNIILILADDLGYSDLGAYGSEIKTPNLDRLANEGLRLKEFYNNSICAPTRASLLTGQYQHTAGVGYFANDLGLPAYQGYLNKESLTLAEVLKTQGYNTLMSGKWHVAGKDVSFPWQRGFDHVMMSENGSYFDQGDYEGGKKRAYTIDGKPYPLEAGKFYQTDVITQNAVNFLDQSAKDKPFFLYLAYTAPHWPLHALPEDIAKYKGRYDKGWDVLRAERIKKQKELGIIDGNSTISEKDADIYNWNKLSFDQRSQWAKKMEIFAAMVDRLDQGIGQVLNKLKATGADKNTIILFISDNGAPAEDLVKWYKGAVRNSGPVGTIGSYESQSKNWSYASNSPLKAFKDYMYEGGISSPFIAWYPAKIKPGTVKKGTGHIIDIAPTFYDLAGAAYPKSYQGITPNALAGKSLLPVLFGSDNELKRDEPLFWERAGNRAVRAGKWKLVSTWPGYNWELYNLETDRGETTNVARQNHDVVSRLSVAYFDWAKRTGVVDFATLEAKEPQSMKEFRKSKVQEVVSEGFGF